MTPKNILPRTKIADFIDNLYDGDLHAKRVLSLANATLGVLVSASLAVHAIGQGLAQALGKLSKHGVKQVDRLLSNQGVDVWAFFGYWIPYLVGARTEVVVAMDWTSFARDQQDTVVLSMLTGHGRATPLMWRTVRSSALKGQMKRYEKELLERLREVMPWGVKVTVVADRGFGDCKLFKALTQELGFEYVIRIRGDIYVRSAKGERRKAVQWVGEGVPPKLIIFNGFLVGAKAQHCQARIRQRDRFATTRTIPSRNDCFGAARAASEWPARRAHSTACPNA